MNKESLKNRYDNIETAGLLDGDPYDDVKEYISVIEAEIAELNRYKNRYNNIVYAFKSGDNDLIEAAKNCCLSDKAEEFEQLLKRLSRI